MKVCLLSLNAVLSANLVNGYGTQIFADLTDFRGFFPCKLTTMEYSVYPCKLRVGEHGFDGFSRISRIGSW
ncbi:MAG: hypothetical protein FWG87_10065 [Defluviitaleaceae bacterium]|nr:hypothetical protein [Defluviitaleaceae bacterium]